MDPRYIDIDGCGPKAIDSECPKGVPIAIQYYSRFEMRRKLAPKSDSSLEAAGIMF